MRHRFIAALWLGCALSLAGCDAGADADASSTPPPTPTPTPTPVQVQPKADLQPPALPGGLSIGRFRGSSACLELFENGDAHLNAIQDAPKVQVMGSLSLAPAAKGEVVRGDFAVARIWKGRWTSACRKHHELGQWADRHTILGHTFEAGTHPLTLRSIDKDTLELCAQRCETLERQPTALQGRWRVKGLSGGSEGSENPVDDVIDLDVDEHGGAWFSLGPDRKWAMLSGPMTVKPLGRDRFEIGLHARMVDTGKGVMHAPDSKWRAGVDVQVTAERLPGEGLKVCRAEADGGACTELERMFDAYDHDVH